MSSFLDRLGARHTDVPAIRPRAVSRFESVSSAAPFGDDAAHDATVGTVTTRDAASGALVDNAPSPLLEGTDFDAHARLGTVRPRADAADRAVAPASSASTSPVTVTAEPRPNTISPGRSTLSATPIAPTLIAPTPIAPTPIAPTLSGARIDGVVVAPRSRTQMPTATGDALAQMGALASREPDVVRVHIGRVEVRAILPAARPMPRQSTSTAESRPMTLDRYLGRTDRT